MSQFVWVKRDQNQNVLMIFHTLHSAYNIETSLLSDVWEIKKFP